jgi:hypothetical protein
MTLALWFIAVFQSARANEVYTFPWQVSQAELLTTGMCPDAWPTTVTEVAPPVMVWFPADKWQLLQVALTWL